MCKTILEDAQSLRAHTVLETEAYRTEHLAAAPSGKAAHGWASKGLPKKVTVEEGARFLPTGVGIRLWYEPQTDRIRFSNLFEGLRYTKSFLASIGVREAIELCLRWIWQEHESCVGVKCPYAWLS